MISKTNNIRMKSKVNKNMKKVGIVSCYFKNNYGSMLQAYATQKFLDNNQIAKIGRASCRERV